MSSILPFDKTVVQKIVRFSLDISKLILKESATFMVSLYDVNDIVIDKVYVVLQGQDYINWGNDDTYVFRFVAKEMGFTLT